MRNTSGRLAMQPFDVWVNNSCVTTLSVMKHFLAFHLPTRETAERREGGVTFFRRKERETFSCLQIIKQQERARFHSKRRQLIEEV